MSALQLFTERSGTGPPLVLLHGFTGSIRAWDAIREQLVASCTVVAIDLPGHGRSPAPADIAQYGLRRAADLVAEALAREGIDRAAVMGYSLGGRTALRFALAHADRCGGLVLESTSPGLATAEERSRRRAEDEGRASLIEREGVPAFVRQWERMPLWQGQERLDPLAVAAQREIRLAQSAAGLANSLRGAGAGVDLSVIDELPSLRMPALLIAGALDETYVMHARAMAARLPRAAVHIEPGVGHAVHLERPLEVASLVGAFVRTLAL